MARKINELLIEDQFEEYGVEWELNGETFVTEADSEDEARLYRAMLGGKLLTRTVFVSEWAE